MKVNDYVRTKKGIGKITNISIPSSNNFKVITTDNFNIGVFTKNKCKRTDLKFKLSPNIIDLIEVGDYVNGCEVLDKYNYENCDSHLIVNGNGFNVIMVEDIKSIVTKEQFESMEYKVGEDNE